MVLSHSKPYRYALRRSCAVAELVVHSEEVGRQSCLLALAELTRFFSKTFNAAEWCGHVRRQMAQPLLPEHRAPSPWNISEALPDRPTEKKVRAILRLSFFVEEHGSAR